MIHLSGRLGGSSLSAPAFNPVCPGGNEANPHTHPRGLVELQSVLRDGPTGDALPVKAEEVAWCALRWGRWETRSHPPAVYPAQAALPRVDILEVFSSMPLAPKPERRLTPASPLREGKP